MIVLDRNNALIDQTIVIRVELLPPGRHSNAILPDLG
jgi:hypothetical protein